MLFKAGVSMLALCSASAAWSQVPTNSTTAIAPDASSLPTQAPSGSLPTQGPATPAALQDEPGSTTDAPAEIIVTGSRIQRKDYVSASPVITTTGEALKASGAVAIENSLNQLPQFVPGSNSGGGGATLAASAGRATLNLRGLGDRRTLVLLDGRRLPPASAFNVTDVNIIPQSLVESVETITGGASAVYGSDAIAGVVNFRTRRHFDGLQLDAQVGNNFEGQRLAADASLAGGFSGFGDRLTGLFTTSYTKRDRIRGKELPFYQSGLLSSFLGQGTFAPSATNLPSQAAVNAQFANFTPGTVRNTAALGFNSNGSLFAQNPGLNYLGPLGDGNYLIAGGGVRQTSGADQDIERPLERFTAFGKLSFEISDAATLYAQGLYARTDTRSSIGFSLTQFLTATVSASNPFIPASLRTVLDSRPNPAAPFQINKRFVEVPVRSYDARFETSQIIVGVRGNTGLGDWTYDIYGSRDRNVIDNRIASAVIASRVNQLLQAPDGGRSLCTGGYNPFGLAAAQATSQACVNYISRDVPIPERITQNTVEAAIQGTVVTLPAGDAKLSVSGDWRENTYRYSPGADLVNNDVFAFNQAAPTYGRTTVKEIAGELFVPLIHDTPLIQSLNVTGGIRYSDYNVTGGITSYKGEVEWTPVRGLLIRGGYQRANRAPNVGELFSSPTGTQVQVGNPPVGGDPCDARSAARAGANGAQLRALCIATGVPAATVDSYSLLTAAAAATNTGNIDLDPETAITYTAGAVVRPGFSTPWASGLSLSVDFYDIKIRDVISTVAGNTALSRCYNLDGSNPGYSAANPFCALLSRDAAGQINNIALPYLNLGGVKTRGVDIQVDYTLDLGAVNVVQGVRLSMNSVFSYLDSYQVQGLPGTPFQEFRGTIDYTNSLPLPRWRWLSTASIGYEGFDLGFRWRHLNAMRDVSSVISTVVAAGVPAYDVFDVTGRIAVNERFSLRLGVTNIGDRQPPVVQGTAGFTLPGTYDIIGRSFYVGVTTRF
jgi:outer membrane receptor protein involved in Fe transport